MQLNKPSFVATLLQGSALILRSDQEWWLPLAFKGGATREERLPLVRDETEKMNKTHEEDEKRRFPFFPIKSFPFLKYKKNKQTNKRAD